MWYELNVYIHIILFIFFFFCVLLAVNFSIHSKHSCPETDSKKFAEALLKAFEDMKDLYFPEKTVEN